jgi:hypothetical protein
MLNGSMIVNSDLGKTWKEEAVDRFNVLFQLLPEENEENNE